MNKSITSALNRKNIGIRTREYHVDIKDRHGDYDHHSVWAISPQDALDVARSQQRKFGFTVYNNQTPERIAS